MKTNHPVGLYIKLIDSFYFIFLIKKFHIPVLFFKCNNKLSGAIYKVVSHAQAT